MIKKYMLLRPIKPSTWGITVKQFVDTTKDLYGCDIILSDHSMYIISDTIEALEVLCGHNDLDGTIIEYTGVYDQVMAEDL